MSYKCIGLRLQFTLTVQAWVCLYLLVRLPLQCSDELRESGACCVPVSHPPHTQLVVDSTRHTRVVELGVQRVRTQLEMFILTWMQLTIYLQGFKQTTR